MWQTKSQWKLSTCWYPSILEWGWPNSLRHYNPLGLWAALRYNWLNFITHLNDTSSNSAYLFKDFHKGYTYIWGQTWSVTCMWWAWPRWWRWRRQTLQWESSPSTVELLPSGFPVNQHNHASIVNNAHTYIDIDKLSNDHNKRVICQEKCIDGEDITSMKYY